MRIGLKPYKIGNIKDLIKTILGFLSFRIFRNLGYFRLNTWIKVIKNRKNKKYVFKICFDEEYVGIIAITYEHKESSWNIAYFIFRKYEGRGIATSATRKALTFCKKKGIKHLHTSTNSKNVGSVRVLEKNGFVRLRENTDEIFWGKKL